ncbi:hypothetical protein [Nonomuraea sp. B5E05]
MLVFSFQLGHNPTEIREILIPVVMALVALGVAWSVSGQSAN